MNWIDHVETVDQFTIRIHTREQFPQAIEFLSGPMPVYPNEYYEEVGTEGMSNMPIGTGPYRVVNMKPGEEYRLVRNDDYDWGGPKSPARITNVIIRELPDIQTQVAELIAGGVDVTADLTTDLAERLDGVPGVTAEQAGTLRVFYMGFDAAGRTGSEPITDVRVRQAISHAINRPSIVDNLMRGAARVIDTPCHPAQFGCEDSTAATYAYDVERARALMAEAGYADGFEVDLYAEAPAHEAEAIIGDLAAIGITARLNRLPWEAFRDAQLDNKAPLFLTNWGSYSLADAAAIISVFFGGDEDDFARDAEVTGWLQVADTSTDPDRRREYYGRAIERITDQAYVLPLFSGIRSYGYDSTSLRRLCGRDPALLRIRLEVRPKAARIGRRAPPPRPWKSGRTVTVTAERKAAPSDLHADALVCDLVLPWTDYGSRELRERTLPRFAASGVDFVSLTLASDAESQSDVVSKIARERRYLLDRPDRYRLVATVDDIRAAKADGRLAVSFNLQGTNAFAGDLDMVEPLLQSGHPAGADGLQQEEPGWRRMP